MRDNSLRLTLVQMDSSLGDIAGNAGKIIKIIKANSERNQLLLFPELCLWGYPPKDLLFEKKLILENQLALEEIISIIPPQGMVIVGGVDPLSEGELYNTAFVLGQGKIHQKIYKSLLPNMDVFDELRYFNFSPKTFLAEGIEDNLLIFAEKRILVTICADVWPPQKPYHASPFKGNEKIDLIVNISASPFGKGKLMARERSCRNFIDKYRAPLVYLNSVGANDDLIFDGNSFILNEQGEMVKKMNCFEEGTCSIAFPEEVSELSPLVLPKANYKQHDWQKDNWQEVFSAIKLGLKEYLKKNNFKQVIIGVSGGIDSALVCVLAALALGKANVLAVMLPSKYTSRDSLNDAHELTKRLGIALTLLDIEEKINPIREEITKKYKKISSLTDENLQARMRGLLLMTLSNQNNALLLSTSNKSELAVGYGTLYGDLSGGLNIIGDLFKTEVYKLALWINENYSSPIPRNILAKEPSAELKQNQKDKDTLPDYETLDKLLEEIIVHQREDAELLKLGFSKEMIKDIRRKIALSEYKRYQSPPILKLSAKSFGPGRRIPVTKQNKIE